MEVDFVSPHVLNYCGIVVSVPSPFRTYECPQRSPAGAAPPDFGGEMTGIGLVEAAAGDGVDMGPPPRPMRSSIGALFADAASAAGALTFAAGAAMSSKSMLAAGAAGAAFAGAFATAFVSRTLR